MLNRYTASEINRVFEELREEYDIVRLVDVEECRVMEVDPSGGVVYKHECFSIWGRSGRCENCTSFRAGCTHCTVDKCEYLGNEREDIHSVPIELILSNGEPQPCVIECVRSSGTDEKAAKAAAEHERPNDRSRDVLTRLYTAEKLLREIRRQLISEPDNRYVIVMSNIRYFGLLNQLFGMEKGNLLLVALGDMLRETCGPETIYGRFRDDRFVIMTKDPGFDPAVLAARMQDIAAELVESNIFDANIKLGALEVTDRNMPVTVMMEHAELAVESICDQRDSSLAWFTTDLLEQKLWGERVLADFEKALADGEFRIYLQPQVDSLGNIRGAEALVRWVRSDGVKAPGEFIPVLSQADLLCHLDKCVWEQAASVLSRWRGTALDHLSIAVNVDSNDFYYLDVPRTLAELCDKYEVRRSALRVEITETALAENVELQSEMVERLQKEGFTVEIDDFGRGSSSLSFLKDIHANALKIDMGFLASPHNSERSRIILGSVIEMAKNLGMGVLTEGVETSEQLKSLSEIGCRNFQGYYFSRPIPVPDFETIARENIRPRA